MEEEKKKKFEIVVRRGGEMESWEGGGQGVRRVIRGKCAKQQRRFLSTAVRQGQGPLMENLSLMTVKSVMLDTVHMQRPTRQKMDEN